MATKDLGVASLIEPWKGDGNGISAVEFFESVDEASELGKLTAKDKVRLAKLKLESRREIVLFSTA